MAIRSVYERRSREGGQASLIGLLAAVALLLVLAWALMGRGGHKSRTAAGNDITNPSAQTTYGQALQRGHDVECMNNLNQVRAAIRMAAQTGAEEGNPASLQELSAQGITPPMTKCPVSGLPYSYDPRTGQVRCLTRGHERF